MKNSLRNRKKETTFWRFLKFHPGKVLTLHEAIHGDGSRHSTKGKTMNNNNPDGIDSAAQAKLLGRDKPSPLDWFRGLSDSGQFAVWMCLGLPLTGILIMVAALYLNKH